MTENTKELLHKISCMLFDKIDDYIAFKHFLEKIDHYEINLTQGGLIQDAEGNICKNGDYIYITSYEYPKKQKLIWNPVDRSFWIEEIDGYKRRLLDLNFKKWHEDENITK